MASFKCLPPTIQFNPFLSFSIIKKKYDPWITLMQDPKKDLHHHHCLSKQQYFLHRVVWPSFCVSLSWSEFHRENRKTKTFSPLSLSFFLLYPFSYSFLVLLYLLLCASITLPNPSSLLFSCCWFFAWGLLLFCYLVIYLMKKMKRVVFSVESPPRPVYEDKRTRLRH